MDIKKITHEFNNEIDALRLFITSIEPVVVDNYNSGVEESQKLLNEQEYVKRVFQLTRIADDLKERIKGKKFAESAADQKEKEELEKEVNKIYNQSQRMKRNIQDVIEFSELNQIKVSVDVSNASNTEENNSVELDDLRLQMKKVQLISRQLNLLYRSAFISLINISEFTFSRLLYFHYAAYPESAQIKDKQLTFNELLKFDSVEDAKHYLIERKIEGVIRDSVQNWFRTLSKDLKFQLDFYDSISDEIIEMFQRRNIIVHNGGIVNSIYINSVAEKYKDGVEKDSPIPLTVNYIESKINQVQILFNIVCCEFAKRQGNTIAVLRDDVFNVGYANMVDKRWNVSSGIFEYLIGAHKDDAFGKAAAELNYWLSLKKRGNIVEFNKLTKNLDYSDKAPLLTAGLEALKENWNRCILHLQLSMKTDTVGWKDIFAFPILAELRDTEEFSQWIKLEGIDKNKYENLNLYEEE